MKSWWKEELKKSIEEGKRRGREKRLEHNTKVKKFFGRRKKKDERKDKDSTD